MAYALWKAFQENHSEVFASLKIKIALSTIKKNKSAPNALKVSTKIQVQFVWRISPAWNFLQMEELATNALQDTSWKIMNVKNCLQIALSFLIQLELYVLLAIS